MKKIFILMICILCTGCSVNDTDLENLKKENMQLKNEIQALKSNELSDERMTYQCQAIQAYTINKVIELEEGLFAIGEYNQSVALIHLQASQNDLVLGKNYEIEMSGTVSIPQYMGENANDHHDFVMLLLAQEPLVEKAMKQTEVLTDENEVYCHLVN